MNQYIPFLNMTVRDSVLFVILVACLATVILPIAPFLTRPFQRVASRAKLWLAGGIVACLMFAAGIGWAVCGLR